MMAMSSKPAETSCKQKQVNKKAGPTRGGKTFSAALRGTENPP
jgi:hypothetical protein